MKVKSKAEIESERNFPSKFEVWAVICPKSASQMHDLKAAKIILFVEIKYFPDDSKQSSNSKFNAWTSEDRSTSKSKMNHRSAMSWAGNTEIRATCFQIRKFNMTQFLFFRDNNKIEGRSKASEISSAAAQARRIIAGHFNRSRLFHSPSFQTVPAASDSSRRRPGNCQQIYSVG